MHSSVREIQLGQDLALAQICQLASRLMQDKSKNVQLHRWSITEQTFVPCRPIAVHTRFRRQQHATPQVWERSASAAATGRSKRK